MQRVVVLTNSIDGLYCFRKELFEKLLEERFEVFIAAPDDFKSEYFSNKGCVMISTMINRRGINPIQDMKLLYSYYKMIKSVEPDVVLTYTIKPNVYGGFICGLLDAPHIATITGMGSSIENGGILSSISLFLYKTGLMRTKTVFFQNNSNRMFFMKKQLISYGRAKDVPGSGVNLKNHCFEDYPIEDGLIRFIYIGRIMRAKGVEELFEAAEVIADTYHNVEFHFIGGQEEDYNEEINTLEKNGIIHYHGDQENVHAFIKDSHATINPSHHEGMSNALLESASTGRPIIASNIPGCQETFEEGVSGFGFEAKNVSSLVNAIKKFIELPYKEKQIMGLAGRRKMETEFDRGIVVQAYFDEIVEILKQKQA